MTEQPLVIFQENDVRIITDGEMKDMPVFIVQAKIKDEWQFQAEAFHVKPALALADSLVKFMDLR